jgi:toxin ParE1/3/4
MRIILADRVSGDLARIRDHLDAHAASEVAIRIASLLAAVNILLDNPEMGRPVTRGRRELVIGRKARGYVALYKFISNEDLIWILAIRSQRESGYRRARKAQPARPSN